MPALPSDSRCHLCGLPAVGSNISQSIGGSDLHFCCPGCLYVFQILRNSPEGVPEDYRETELFRACVAAGLIPSPETGKINPASRSEPAGPVPADITDIEEGLSQELSIRIEGMWCVACSWLLEQLLRKIDGVLNANVFFFSDIARIKYMPHAVQPEAIMKSISRLGYRALPIESSPDSGRTRGMVVRLGVSAILSMNIMMISFALWAGFFEEIGREGAAFFSYTLWVLATPVVFYGGRPILARAFQDVRRLAPTMDTLIAIGVLATYVYSIAAMVMGSIHVYFDTASMLVTLTLLGRFIETRAKEKISGSITTLFHAASGKVRTVRDGKETWAAPDMVSPGDTFLVFPGERVPVDGRVSSGAALLDESLITGEARPVKRERGSDVFAGSLLMDGNAEFEATRTGSESSLSQIIALIQEALSTKNRFEQFGDRVMRVLVPAVLALAALVAACLLARSAPPGEAVLRALTVLVITCPCALGIATPLARVAEIAKARASGTIIRNPAALELAGGLDIMIFDKTGTITEGNYSLRRTVTPGEDADRALRLVASAEAKSDHFLAQEIRKAAALKSLPLEGTFCFEPMEGMGVVAIIESGEVIAGTRALMRERGQEFSGEFDDQARRFEAAGSTVVFFAWDRVVRGFFVFGDSLKRNAKEIVSGLRADGVSVWVVSGDSEETTGAFARQAGADHFAGQMRPQDKAKIIKKLQAEGKRVAMVGDGINDAAALAGADIGITLGAGANLIRECSDAAILGDDLEKIPALLELARFSEKIIKQNLFFSFLYNAMGIPIAVAGILNPLAAALAMFASSLSVICNTSRISKFKSGVEGDVPETHG